MNANLFTNKKGRDITPGLYPIIITHIAIFRGDNKIQYYIYSNQWLLETIFLSEDSRIIVPILFQMLFIFVSRYWFVEIAMVSVKYRTVVFPAKQKHIPFQYNTISAV
jgi:hypothetical protein